MEEMFKDFYVLEVWVKKLSLQPLPLRYLPILSFINPIVSAFGFWSLIELQFTSYAVLGGDSVLFLSI